jgi:amidase
MTADTSLCFASARDLAARLRAKDISARDVLEAHLAQIDRVNPQVNAIVTLVADRAMDAARDADDRLARGETVGILHGLPIAHKDLVATKGVRTTQGSPIFADHVPDFDAAIVERLRDAGAVMLGKTNTPEFGAGSQTFNEVFGVTRNPYDLSKTCGGSSGGAAVALACGMLPIADGSDTGGSLRNPASFCNVVGLRPSPGRVPDWPSADAWSPLSVKGPMARNAADAALLLAAMAGPDPASPLTASESGDRFLHPLDRDFRGVRVAWSPGLGGLPVDPRVAEVIDRQRSMFEDLGCDVVDVTPDFTGADESFRVYRALGMETGLGHLLDANRNRIKQTVIWNIEAGRQLTGPQVASAARARTQLFHRFRQFMDEYEFLLCPVSQVPPFDITTEYPTSINGVDMETYIDWMRSAWLISATAHPAASVPVGFTSDGLPVGLQVVGRFRDEFGILQLAHAIEQLNPAGQQRPAILR